MDSKNADMQNINYVGGAALLELIFKDLLNKTPWAHLDIAGMAFPSMEAL